MRALAIKYLHSPPQRDLAAMVPERCTAQISPALPPGWLPEDAAHRVQPRHRDWREILAEVRAFEEVHNRLPLIGSTDRAERILPS